MMRGGSCAVSGAVVKQIISSQGLRRGRQTKRPCGPRSIVTVDVPFISKCARRKRVRPAWRERSHGRVPPEPHLSIRRRNQNGETPVVIRSRTIRFKERARKGVFGSATICGRAEAGVTPCAAPGRRLRRIDLCERQRFLVA